MALKSPAYRHTPLRRHLPLLSAVALLLAALAACHRAPDARLALADSLMEARPDSALAVLHSIPSASLSSASDRALHALLLTQARHKNYIDETSDSLISTAVGYFSAHHVDSLLMRSLYYDAVINFNHGNSTASYKKALRSNELACTRADAYWTAKTNELLGDICARNYLNAEAAAHYAVAADSFASLGRIESQGYAIAMQAANTFEASPARAFSLLDSLSATIAASDAYPWLKTYILETRLSFYNKSDSLDTAAVARLLHSLSAIDDYQPSVQYFCMAARLMMANGDLPAASQLINLADSVAGPDANSLLIPLTQQRLALCRGDYAAAYRLASSLLKMQNQVVDTILSSNIQRARSDYYLNASQARQHQVAALRSYIIIGTAGVILLIAILVIVHIVRIRLRDARINRRLVEVYALMADIENLRSENSAFRSHLATTVSPGIDALNTFCKTLTKIPADNAAKARAYDRVRAACIDFGSQSKIESLVALVNQAAGGLLAQLRQPEFGFSDADIQTLAFILAGINPHSQSFLTSTKINTTYSQRRRLREKLAAIPSLAQNIFVQTALRRD